MGITMWNTITSYGAGVASKASDKYAGYMAKDDLERALVEATANENWNVSNTLLLTISDATY